jgi:hypothetical protein
MELSLGLTLSERPPYTRLLDCLDQERANRLLSLAGYEPPVGDSAADYRAWRRSSRIHHPAFLFTAASRLAHIDTLLHRPGQNRLDVDDDTRRLLLWRPGILVGHPADIWRTRPAFRAYWTSYTSGFHTALRSYGPAIPQLALLDGRRYPDFLLGTTLLELKSGRLDHMDYLNALIDQLLTYTLLAHHDGHPVTHFAVYAARYQRLLRYPAQQTLDQLAGAPIDPTATGADLAAEIRASEPRRPAA